MSAFASFIFHVKRLSVSVSVLVQRGTLQSLASEPRGQSGSYFPSLDVLQMYSSAGLYPAVVEVCRGRRARTAGVRSVAFRDHLLLLGCRKFMMRRNCDHLTLIDGHVVKEVDYSAGDVFGFHHEGSSLSD